MDGATSALRVYFVALVVWDANCWALMFLWTWVVVSVLGWHAGWLDVGRDERGGFTWTYAALAFMNTNPYHRTASSQLRPSRRRFEFGQHTKYSNYAASSSHLTSAGRTRTISPGIVRTSGTRMRSALLVHLLCFAFCSRGHTSLALVPYFLPSSRLARDHRLRTDESSYMCCVTPINVATHPT